MTPQGGSTAIRPVHVGGYLASHAREGVFGLGRAQQATVEVVWGHGIRNKLYDIGQGERVTFPEIPCRFDEATVSFQSYESCVTDALDGLITHGSLSPNQRGRFLPSAIRAFHEAR